MLGHNVSACSVMMRPLGRDYNRNGNPPGVLSIYRTLQRESAHIAFVLNQEQDIAPESKRIGEPERRNT